MGIRTRKAVSRVLISLGLVSMPWLLTACNLYPDSLQQGLASIPLTTEPNLMLTLTAWPTLPPILTRAPTVTAEPRLLWAAATEDPPTPSVIPKAPTSTAASDPPEVVVVPKGSLPPPVRLQIPVLTLDVNVVEVSWDFVWDGAAWTGVWETADDSVGHHRPSANPGEAGNVVIAGHHNTKGEPFRQVSEIGRPGALFQVGDEVILISQNNSRHTYTVTSWDRFPEEGVVPEERAQHARYLDDTTDGTLTLVTCWPYESNTHRVVVVAKLAGQ